MEAAHIAFLANVLSHIEEIKIDWQKVAEENGISRKDNATTKFRGMMKKYGVDFSNNKFTIIDGHDFGAPPATPKKRKTEHEPAGDETPKKKAATKAKKASTKVEGLVKEEGDNTE